MRERRSWFPLAFCLLLLPTAVFADSITSLSPSTFTQFEAESYIVIDGTGLQGSVSTEVVFSGSPGTFTLEPISTSGTELLVPVPDPVLSVPGTVSVTVIATDAGNVVRTIGPATFTVQPLVVNLPPLLSIPEVVVAEATSPSGAVVSYSASAFSFVDPVATLSCSPASGIQYPLGATTVSCTASDSFGSTTGTFTVFVGDTTPPVVTVPADIVTNNPVVTFTATAVDNLDGAITPVCSPASGSTFPTGTTVVTCHAVDLHANQGSASFRVTVGTTPPSLGLPANMTVPGQNQNGAVVNFTVTTDAGATVVCTPPSGSTFGYGLTTVNCTATNAGGGFTTGSFTIDVVGGDTTPPVLTLPSDMSVEATGPNGATVNFIATAVDDVDGPVPVVCTPPSGSVFPLGLTVVHCSASDAAGNVASGTFNVVVVDTTPPTIVSATATPATLWPPNHQMVNITVSVTAVDLVDPAPVIHIVSVSSDQPINGTGDGDTSPDWVITGPLTLQLRAERASGVIRTYTITFTATDFSGNVSTGTVLVTVTGNKRHI